MLGSISQYLVVIPAVLIVMTFHELAHGLVAYWLGDNTAKEQGRLTLNPFAHIDWLGLVCMIIARIGWAKPVPVNAANFKNPRWGMALCALAGPFANILLSFVTLMCYTVISIFSTSTFGQAASEFLFTMAAISAGLAIFNLIPIPPLDGSRILAAFLPSKIAFWFEKYGSTLQIVLLALVFFGAATNFIITGEAAIINFFLDVCVKIIRLFGVTV